jgi:hypothetical protein
MSLRVGSLVYATEQGLGVLAKSFFDAGVVTHPIIVRHGRHPNHDVWYPPGTPQLRDLRRDVYPVVDAVMSQVDVMLFFETPFDWSIIPRCRDRGVKTAIMPMFECMPAALPYQPDGIINPSLLDQQYYPRGEFIPVPVEYPWRRRERALEFVHNAGHGGLRGRNGTAELVEAMRWVKSKARLTLRAQESSRQYWAGGMLRDSRGVPTELPPGIDLKIGTFPYEEMFATGDVFVFPEKFNGLSLPLQEARAAGMLVMCGDRFPMNTWLPREPLIPVAGYRKEKIGPPYNQFDEAVFDPRAIAAKIDEWYGRDISAYSEAGQEWAVMHSWNALKLRYTKFLESLL